MLTQNPPYFTFLRFLVRQSAVRLDIDPVPSRLQELFSTLSRYDDDYFDVRRQESAKLALVIADGAGAVDNSGITGVRKKKGSWAIFAGEPSRLHISLEHRAREMENYLSEIHGMRAESGGYRI